jgi:hypothetical protein
MELEEDGSVAAVGLEKVNALDNVLKEESSQRMDNRQFQKMLAFRQKLPSYNMRQASKCHYAI